MQPLNEADSDQIKKLAKMELSSFLAPSNGLGAGLGTQMKEPHSNKNFLHARIFARNLGINEQKVFAQHQTNLRFRLHGLGENRQRRGLEFGEHDQCEPFDDEENEPVIQGRRVAMESQKPLLQKPTVSRPSRRPATQSRANQNSNQTEPPAMLQGGSFKIPERQHQSRESPIQFHSGQTISPKTSSDDNLATPESPEILKTCRNFEQGSIELVQL